MGTYLIFGGKSSREYGIYISGAQTFGAPERDVETVDIPGRNGSLIIDNGRLKNITVSYPAYIRSDFPRMATAARNWLLAEAGYRRLEDTYSPDFYRMARFSGPLDFDTQFLNRSAECTLSFDCMPQRFDKRGEYTIRLQSPKTLINPYPFTALPLIRVYGSGAGNLMVGNTVVQVKAIDGYMDLDCDTQNAYKGSVNCNAQIYAPDFPQLEGKTGISWDGKIDHVEITPRWWTI